MSEPQVVLPFPVAERQAWLRWLVLADHLEESYHKPDLEGIRVVMAAALAHHLWPDSSPVWLMVIGPSGTGKTAMMMSVLAGVPGFYPLSNLTPQTLMSGYVKEGSKKDPSLLTRLGPSFVLGISDFSSISSMKEEGRAQVASQLREVFDGRISKDFGIPGQEGGVHREWQGKATCIVGCTKDVEHQWSLQRSLGERFLYLRWRTGDAEQLALSAARQDSERLVKEATTRFAKEIFEGALKQPPLEASLEEIQALGLERIAALVARLRCGVMRDKAGTVVDTADPEGPGRIMRTLYQVMRAHASLFGRTQIELEDSKAGLRIAYDSIPALRLKLLMAAMNLPPDGFSRDQLDKQLKEEGLRLAPSTMHVWLLELLAIGAIEEASTSQTRWYKVEDWTRARILELKVGLEERLEEDEQEGALRNMKG